ncbi:MAG: dihydrolipoyl dehydrogenase [Paramuribaculum sp.]|nr:dihydrolipoyl dehydrogenase [Paramuribaculum sp.]
MEKQPNVSDLIIIGAGPGGYETAEIAAKQGRKVVLIERDELGGTCLNRGCIPTKALCRSAEVARTVAEAVKYGCSTSSFTFDFAKAVERKEEVVRQLRDGVAILLRDVNVVKGEARILGAGKVSVGEEVYTAPQIIIATGSRPAVLPIPGTELAINSDFALDMRSLPESIAIIGGGVIGLEFASIFNSFGVDVTVLEYCPEILPPFDAEIAKRLRMTMKRQGVEIVTGAQVTAIAEYGESLRVSYTAKGKEKAVEASTVLMAVGRKAVLPEGTEEAGIRTVRGFIEVNDCMETSVEGFYAIGDVNGRCMLAHAASAQGRVALGMEQLLDPIPSAVFTSPECAMTGLTEAQCRDAGLEFSVGTAFFRANGKAVASGESDGLVKVLTERESGRILGCHICGPHAADLIQIASVAISGGLSALKIDGYIFPHPTLSEALRSAIEASIAV